MRPPLSDQVREEIAEYFIKCEDTRCIHQATTVSINQINRLRRNWERSEEVRPKHVDQGRPALLSKEIVDDLLFFFYLKGQLSTWMR